MADGQEEDNEFGKELADAFAADEEAENPTPAAPADDSKKPEEPNPAAPQTPKVEEPKKDDQPKTPEDPNKKEEPGAAPAADEKKPEAGAETPKDPKAPGEEDKPAPQPLTKDDVTEVINKIRTDERVSSQELETATKEVMDAYYPEGVSNVLVDSTSGKELRTPKDVVDASGGEMSMEEAANWLMNEQFKLDTQINKIKEDAKAIAETTVKFKQDSIAVMQRYEPLFKAYPQVQAKVWDNYKKLIKTDEAKGVILSAPDMMDFYDTVLEPYRLAYEYGQKQSATNPVPPAGGTPAPAPTPGMEDRLDEGGDGGTSAVDDPNDFAQQVSKELAREL